jgi:molybdopterin/thiamine biosynthesis adenylyltransferase/rhodanese-related sulfurtransferase
MPEVGLAGQMALREARVLIVGAGGLGSPSALYLAAAGVGALGIVDADAVDATNLQRQIIHGTSDLGRPKTASAAETITELNPLVEVVRHDLALSSANAMEVLSGYDVVIDGTDNFPTRYLINDACVLLGKPYAYGSIFRFDGQATVFAAPGGPCYRCLFPEPPPPGTVPSCAEGGVLGILPGVIGLIQATEAIKLIIGRGESLVGRLLLYSALEMRFQELAIRPDPACPVCGPNPTVRQLIDYEAFCGLPGASHAAAFEAQVGAVELRAMMDRGEPFVLVDVREPHEREINRIPSSLPMPLAELPARVHELDTADVIVVHCLSGARSAQACRFLRDAGFGKVRNLTGGIRAWIAEVDPSQRSY